MGKIIKKELSAFKLISTIVVLVAAGAFVIITSGILDTPEAKGSQHNHTNSQMGSSVNLEAVNEINRLEDLVKSDPNNHEALLNLGHLLNDNGFYQRAIPKYEAYLKVHPDNADVIVDMGVCYFEMKQYDKSIEVIKSALKIIPEHQIAHFNLGIVNFSSGNENAAKDWWKKARDIDPTTNIGKKAEELLKSNN